MALYRSRFYDGDVVQRGMQINGKYKETLLASQSRSGLDYPGGVELYKNGAILFITDRIHERRRQNAGFILNRRKEKGDTLSP